MAKKKGKMTAGAASGVGRLEKIGKKPATSVEGEQGKKTGDKSPRR